MKTFLQGRNGFQIFILSLVEVSRKPFRMFSSIVLQMSGLSPKRSIQQEEGIEHYILRFLLLFGIVVVDWFSKLHQLLVSPMLSTLYVSIWLHIDILFWGLFTYELRLESKYSCSYGLANWGCRTFYDWSLLCPTLGKYCLQALKERPTLFTPLISQCFFCFSLWWFQLCVLFQCPFAFTRSLVFHTQLQGLSIRCTPLPA